MFKKHPPQRGNQPARQNNRLSPTISQRQPQPHDRPNLLHTNHGNSHNYRSKIPRIHQLWTNHHRNDPHIHRRTIHRPRHKRRPHKIPSTIPLRRQNMGSKLISQSGPDDQYPGRLNPHSTHLHLLRISGQTGLPSTRNSSTDPDFLLKPPRPVSAQHGQIDLHRIRANETGKPHGDNPIHNKERPIPAAGFFGYGALGAATGHTAAILVTGIVGVTIIQFTYLKQRTEITSTINFIKASKTLLSYGAPLFLSLIINGSIMQIYNFLMALNVTPSEVGNY